jgi:hypothetical protein
LCSVEGGRTVSRVAGELFEERILRPHIRTLGEDAWRFGTQKA